MVAFAVAAGIALFTAMLIYCDAPLVGPTREKQRGDGASSGKRGS